MFVFLFICSLLVPLSMIILGKRWGENPPKKKNIFSGYRTTMSMLNQDTWEYAHKYWGKINLILGGMLLAVTTILLIGIRNHTNFENLVVCLVFIQIAIMALTIIPTEVKLRKVFTKTGQRK